MTARAWETYLDDLIARRLRAHRRSRRVADADADAESEPAVTVIDLPARTESLSPLTAFVTEAARRGGLPARDTTFVEVAIYEACLNVIEHGYGFDASRRLRLDLLEDDERLTFRITDTGPPIDSAVLEGAADNSAIDVDARRAGRGLGLRIIRRAMDEVTYETEDGENCLTLVKRVRTATARV